MKQCRNTEQGRWNVTDDHGVVCSRQAIDPLTGCCTKGEKPYSCLTCSPDDLCCESYEFCVSCCLDPKYNASKLYRTVYRGPRHPETGKWNDEFEYCQGKCRTHSRSTAHENAYISKRHFCFSEDARPLVPEPEVPPLPSDVTVVVGNPGEDCNTICTRKSRKCAPEHFYSLNSCNLMRDNFICEADCRVSEDHHEEAHYVTGKAHKDDFPAACFIGKESYISDLESCEWRETNIQRLCPCRAAFT